MNSEKLTDADYKEMWTKLKNYCYDRGSFYLERADDFFNHDRECDAEAALERFAVCRDILHEINLIEHEHGFTKNIAEVFK